MAVARVSSKGRVTIPLEIRQKLALEAGSRVAFVLTSEGKVVIEPFHTSVRTLEGVFHKARLTPVSLEDMENAIEAEASGATF